MKALAKAQGLWNLWISPHLAACMGEVVSDSGDRALLGAGLSNLVSHHSACGPCTSANMSGMLSLQKKGTFSPSRPAASRQQQSLVGDLC